MAVMFMSDGANRQRAAEDARPPQAVRYSLPSWRGPKGGGGGVARPQEAD